MVQSIEELRDQVHTHVAILLAAVVKDPGVPRDGLTRWLRCAGDFESAVDAILTEPWIPKTIAALSTSLMAMNVNIEHARADIEAALDFVFDGHDSADAQFRIYIAMNFQTLLEMQRDVLMDTMIKMMPPAKWAS